MTENEAKAKLERTSVLWESATNTEMVEAVKLAIKALEEIQRYREIGTIEECTKAVLNIEHFYILGRTQAIDEFARAVKNKYPIMEDCFGVRNVNRSLHRDIDNIAEQMMEANERSC